MAKNTKIKLKKETRDEKARRILKEKIEKKEVDFGKNLKLVQLKNSYITNIINGRYYLARLNMMAVQIKNKKIKEDIDGCLKSEEFLRSEYALTKLRAINSMRQAHFDKQSLFKEHSLTEKDIFSLEEDYYNGKVIRESYDESYKKRSKAEFIDSSKD